MTDQMVRVGPEDFHHFSRTSSLLYLAFVVLTAYFGSYTLSFDIYYTALWIAIAVGFFVARRLCPRFMSGRSFKRMRRTEWRFQVAYFAFGVLITILIGLNVIFRPSGITVLVLLVILGFSSLFISWIQPWTMIISQERDGRLSILQFLEDREAGTPDYRFLARGIGILQNRLRAIGIAVPEGDLYLGASYSFFSRKSSERELRTLADWTGQPGEVPLQHHGTDSALRALMGYAKDAKDTGYVRVIPFLTKMAQIPWSNLYYAALFIEILVLSLLGKALLHI